MVDLFLKNLIIPDKNAAKGDSLKQPLNSYEIDFTAKAKTTTKPEGLTPEGNIPIAKTQKNEHVGLVIEKTTTAPKESKAPKIQQAKPKEEKQTSDDFEKTGDSIDERLTRYYPKAYKNASVEKKEALLDKYITQHCATLKDKSRAEQIKIQLADFKKLIHNTRQGDDYEMLASKINVLEKENQVIAAKNATVEQKSDELRYRGEIGVARSIHKTDNENQLELTKLITDSKNEKAITIGASHASELATENQTPAVGLYQKTGLNAEQQKAVDKVLINQYAQYAKENQVDIHKIMSSSKYTETVQYAASNIYNFDKSNQTDAFQVTMATKNESAINAASAQYARYDDSVKNDIKTLVNNSEYKSAQATLTKAEAETEAKTISQESNTKTESNIADENQAATSGKEKIEEIKAAAKGNNTQKLTEKLQALSPGERRIAIATILANNPSLEVIAQVGKMIKENDNLIDNDVLASKMKYFDEYTQSTIISRYALSHDLSLIDTNDLKSLKIKNEYNNLKLEEKDRTWLV